MKTPNVDEFIPLKNARLEIARVRGRGSEISPSLSYSRPLALALALSSLAFFKTSKFQARFRFLCENIAFFFF